jgi:beta-glucosidase
MYSIITRFLIACCILLFFQNCNDMAPSSPVSSTSAALDAEIEELLSRMTIEDKVGEMTQFAIDVLIKRDEDGNFVEPHQIDPEKARQVLVELKTGSILNVAGHAYPRDQWQQIITDIQKFASEKESKIPVLFGIDAIHGVNYTSEGSLYPQQIGLAATWNPQLVEDLAAMTAYECRASNIPWTFSPVMDLGRDTRWARFWEGFGEDVLLASTLGAAMTKGYQGPDPSDPNRIAACLKHYLGYSFPLTGMDRTQAWIPERQLREYFLPPFKAGVDAGVLTVMVNSGEINGIPAHANKYLLTDVLKEELGFEGLVVTDWQDIHYLHERHLVSKDYKESIKMAINAGIDMSMVPFDLKFPTLLVELVREGEVSMSRIDDAVRRVLRVKKQIGLFDQKIFEPNDHPLFSSEEHQQLALKGAQESIVLAKNDNNILPIPKSATLLVTGPAANTMVSLNGGWSYTWQGDDVQYHPEGKSTILEAIRTKIGDDHLLYIEGTSFDEDINTSKAAARMSRADAAVVCIGESSYTEKPGDVDDINLPDSQIDLVKALAASGKPVILVLVEGRPRIMRDAEPLAEGILIANLPGNEGGQAIADILFGDYNPSGKLPYTYPRYSNNLVKYDHRGTDIVESKAGRISVHPQFPFGHGLSYTSFEYSNLQISGQPLRANGSLTISVDVKNAGGMLGAEVVQLYISDQVASITPSLKRLRGYEKVTLSPGEQKNVRFTISPRDLAFVGQNLKWRTEPGSFKVQIDQLEEMFEMEGKLIEFEE